MLYGSHSSSIPQKTVIVVAQTIVLAVAIWMLLAGGLDAISGLLHVKWAHAVPLRGDLLSAAYCIVYLRIVLAMFYLLKRSLSWQEAIPIPVAFAVYYWGFTLLAGPVSAPVGATAYVGVALFLIGSFLNTGGELLRDSWKKVPANHGKLYTGGLFRYSMHINYFGDVVWIIGLACLSGNPWSAIIPFMIFIFFAFYNAPLLDRHLAANYGKEFEEYKARTKRLVPFIY
ncbi:MAG TPA: DUF1295 domain-containing protein [Spirochaetia bacterium]|nr:DUF1295 domain-containing protein [Spirochaetia bacterium]